MNEFQQWAEVIKHVEAEQLGFDDGKTKISGDQFVADVNLIAQWIPETHLQNEKMASQGIALWTHQLSYMKRGTNNVGVPILHALADAIRLVLPLPGRKALLKCLHTDHGMFLQLQTTYFIGKHIRVTGVEQEKVRVDIVAEVESKTLNLHVKNTHPFTKGVRSVCGHCVYKSGLDRSSNNKLGQRAACGREAGRLYTYRYPEYLLGAVCE